MTTLRNFLRKSTFTALLVAVAFAGGGATECGEVIDDSGFELWCDDHLCDWELEKGDVARAPTWIDEDSGVELVGDDVAISQLTPVEFSDGHCIRFTLVADVEETAEVHLQLDVYGDGTVEDDERIPTSDWHKQTFLVKMPPYYEGIRFRLTKRGGGRAVLANIGAATTRDADCGGAPLVLGPRPYGAACTGDGECASGLCDGDGPLPSGAIWPGVCATCLVDTDCTGGQVCARVGANMGVLDVAKRCVAPASVPTGAACDRGVECASGLCAGNVCMGCASAADCGGRACDQVTYSSPVATWTGPYVCGPGGAAGAACLNGGGCASGVCNGPPLRVCLLSRRECNVESDCPTFGTDGEDSCVTVGTRGGTCQ